MHKFDKGADAHGASRRFRRGAFAMSDRNSPADSGDLAVDERRDVYHQRLQKRLRSAFSPTRSGVPRKCVGAPRPYCRQRWFERRRIWSNSFLQDGREGPSRDHHATFGLKVRVL